MPIYKVNLGWEDHNKPKPIKDKRYSTKLWREYSYNTRAMNPICNKCKTLHYDIANLSIDHIIPIENKGSFYDPRNHEILCISCHSTKTLNDRYNGIGEYVLNDDQERIPNNK